MMWTMWRSFLLSREDQRVKWFERCPKHPLNGSERWKARFRRLSHAYYDGARCTRMIGRYLCQQTPGTNSRNVLLDRRSATSNSDLTPRGSAVSSGLIVSYLSTIIIGQPWISFCKLSFPFKVATRRTVRSLLKASMHNNVVGMIKKVIDFWQTTDGGWWRRVTIDTAFGVVSSILSTFWKRF